MSDISEIRAYWTKPDPPTVCSACQREVQRSPLTAMPGMLAEAPCPHCGERAGYTFTFTTDGRSAKADILTLLAALSASGAGVDSSQNETTTKIKGRA
jgi:hypothetical protein